MLCCPLLLIAYEASEYSWLSITLLEEMERVRNSRMALKAPFCMKSPCVHLPLNLLSRNRLLLAHFVYEDFVAQTFLQDLILISWTQSLFSLPWGFPLLPWKSRQISAYVLKLWCFCLRLEPLWNDCVVAGHCKNESVPAVWLQVLKKYFRMWMWSAESFSRHLKGNPHQL